MDYALYNDEKLDAGLRRIALEQLDGAIGGLEASGRDPDRVVHETRKHLKRVRGLIRMLKGAVPGEIWSTERRRVRDAARLISDLRDSAVMIDTVDLLIAERGPSEELLALRRRLVESHEALCARSLGQERVLEQVAEALRQARTRVTLWTDVPDGFDAIRGGLRRVHSKGRDHFAEARGTGDAEAHHDWRKWVKHLWYATQILHPVHPEQIGGLRDQLDLLGEALGKEHDLANQGELIGGGSEEVQRAIAASRRQLQVRAVELGESIYATTTDTFLAELEGWFTSARRLERSAAMI